MGVIDTIRETQKHTILVDSYHHRHHHAGHYLHRRVMAGRPGDVNILLCSGDGEDYIEYMTS